MSHPAMGAPPLPLHVRAMIAFIDWWQLDHPDFTGARCLMDVGATNCTDDSARVIGRIFVMQAATAALRDGDTAPLRCAAAPYVAALFEIDDAETGALWDCLAS